MKTEQSFGPDGVSGRFECSLCGRRLEADGVDPVGLLNSGGWPRCCELGMTLKIEPASAGREPGPRG
jgi:hypothetical protein